MVGRTLLYKFFEEMCSGTFSDQAPENIISINNLEDDDEEDEEDSKR